MEERVSLNKEHSACWTCMQQGHQSKECWIKRKCEVEGCQKFHNASLHKVLAAGIISYTSKVNSSVDPCILLIMSIPMYRSNKFVTSLWGATISLITFHKAKELNLYGKEVSLAILKTGGVQETLESFRYSLHLQDIQDRENRDVCITVHGLPNISTDICKIQTKQLSSLFPGISNLEEVARTAGEVDLLIGLDYASFPPQMVDNVEHLVLYENRFGKCLGGSHPEIKDDTQMVIINVEVNHVNVGILLVRKLGYRMSELSKV